MKTTRRLLIVILVVVCSIHASAFNEAGHMESVRFIVEGLADPTISPAERKVIAACAQLPDLSQELDAAKTYYTAFKYSKLDWIAWGVGDRLSNAPLQRMFAAQQLIHGLTGGDPHSLRYVAVRILKDLVQLVHSTAAGPDRVEALCALGLGLHLWGDSFAHTQVLWDKDDKSAYEHAHLTMYPTGRGHGLSEGHFPDDILCSFYTKPMNAYGTLCNQDWKDEPHRRQALWSIYWSSTRTLIEGKAELKTYFDVVPTDEPLFMKDNVTKLLAAIRAAAGEQAKGGLFDTVDPDEMDVIVGAALRTYLKDGLKMAVTDSLDDDTDPKVKQFRDEIIAVAKSGVTDPAKPCSEVFNMIRGMRGVDKLEQGGRAATCMGVWAKYSPIARRSFAECSGKSSGAVPACVNAPPVHEDWKWLYALGKSNATDSSRIKCFSDLIDARLAARDEGRGKGCDVSAGR